MMSNEANNKSLDSETFSKLQRFYLLAVLLIAGSIIIAQILIQNHLNSQLDDARLINIAGRQRMLSQKLTKNFLIFQNDQLSTELDKSIILKDLDTFQASHLFIHKAIDRFDPNDVELSLAFDEMDVFQKELVEKSKDLITISDTTQSSKNEILKEIQIAESHFLTLMDRIVFKFETKSNEKVKSLKNKELLLFLVTLLILLLEVLFLFRPVSNQVKRVVQNLIISRGKVEKQLFQIEELYDQKESSLKELQGLNYAIDNAALFASVSEDGKVTHLSKKLIQLLNLKTKDTHGFFYEVFSKNDVEQQVLEDIINGNRNSIWKGEVQVTTQSDEKLWLEMSIIPMTRVNRDSLKLILCNNISQRKASQLAIEKINEKRIKEEVFNQKVQASQIVEAQEEESKRIAKDIHDGIGQMLTALKFNIESIKLGDVDQLPVKVEKLKEILGALLKEVRAVTFNLTPPELTDHGIAPALRKLADQLSGFTGKQILFENKTEFKERFDSLTETNVYRIVQEAVNNAIKYADSNYILISMNHSENMLSIVIDDDGKGFDQSKIVSKKGESGMGLFFMQERVSYINGRIFIHSALGEGTRITLNIKIPSV